MSLDRLFDPLFVLVALAALNLIALWVWLKTDRVCLVVKPPARTATRTKAAARTKTPVVEDKKILTAVPPEAEAEPAPSPSTDVGGEERLVQDLKRWLARMEPPGGSRRAAGLHGSPRAQVSP